MTDSQTHLKSAIEQRDAIIKEIQDLNTMFATKRELGLKVQGIIEYLEQTGVKLPEEEAPAPVAEEAPRPEEEVADIVYESDVSFQDMSKDELEDYGRTVGIELDRRHNKKKLIQELEDHLGS